MNLEDTARIIELEAEVAAQEARILANSLLASRDEENEVLERRESEKEMRARILELEEQLEVQERR